MLRKITFLLSLVIAFAFIACDDSNAQSPAQLRLRCAAPYQTQFQTFRLLANGNQLATTCPNGTFSINGAIVPSGTGVASEFAYWSATNTLSPATGINFTNDPAVWAAASANNVFTIFNSSLNNPAGTSIQGLGNAFNTDTFASDATDYNSRLMQAVSPVTQTKLASMVLSATETGNTWAGFEVTDGASIQLAPSSNWSIDLFVDSTNGRLRAGDWSTTPTDYFDLNQTTHTYQLVTQSGITFFDNTTQASYATFNPAGAYTFSDAAASSSVVFDVVNKSFNVQFDSGGGGGLATFAVPTGSAIFGDPLSVGNGTVFEVNDGTQQINLGATTIGFVGATVFSTSFTPALSTDACTAGRISWDASYIYVCTASGAWKRATLNAF